jgi:probable HAF family extracellular repeat protein
MQVLPTPSGSHSTAQGINNLGQIVGGIDGSAVLWDGDMVIYLGTLEGTSQALAINDLGEVVGYSHPSLRVFLGWYWAEGEMVPLGSLGGEYTYPRSINKLGQIVGASTHEDGYLFAFLVGEKPQK